MKFIKLFNYRAGYMVAAAAILLSTFLPSLVSADQVTDRSIALSSSSVKATGVSYTINFTPAKTAGAFVVDFCSDSPVVGEACAAPAGLNVSTATVGSGFTRGTLTTTGNNKVLINADSDMAATTPVSVTLTGVVNPDDAGPLYARIVTYDTSVHAVAYTSTGAASDTNVQDQGGVALSITPTVGVSGAVLESMTFCVSGVAITDNCLTPTSPVLKLGEPVGTTFALDANHLSTGNLFTQISTNATSGAVVNLKSSALGCGGLINSSKPSDCYIKPALTDGVAAGKATFGVKTSTATKLDAVNSNGIFQPAGSSIYNNSTYALNWISGDATGITSTFGDPFLDTAGKPVNGMNMQFTFGASVTNSTPAGSYSTDLSLIATGKF